VITVPDMCLPLLREHRTHYTADNVAEGYAKELERTYEGIKEFLPAIATPRVLDIGCGMCGIDVLLNRHYNGAANFHLLDKQGKAEKINAGFHESADTFAHYHDFEAALELLRANGMEDSGDGKYIKTLDITTDKFPTRKFAIVISLLSWGFHYPISTYEPKLINGGVIIADVRKNTNGIAALQQYGETHVVHEAKKYLRVVVQC